jgi:hypothetical protein
MLNKNKWNLFIASMSILSLTLRYLIPFNKSRKNPFPPFGFDGEPKVTLMCRKCDYKRAELGRTL